MSKRRLELQEYSDSDLVTECLKGNELCQEVLYKRYFSYAMSVSIRYARNRDEAMEVVNDSFMKALDNLNNFILSGSFKAWYSRIIVNTAIDRYRKKIQHANIISTDTIPDTIDEGGDVDIKLSVNEILKMFDQLPDNYRMTFNLFEIEGYTHEEIGQMMGVTTSTSRSNLARAKKLLRDIFFREFGNTDRSNEAV